MVRPAPAVVVVAASTGGPTALARLLEPIPASFPVPIVVVQHMPAAFTRQFAERLDRSCGLTVREAAPRDQATPGTVVIAAGGHHLRFHGPGVLLHDDGDPVLGCRPAADVLFASAAGAYPGRALAVVLTGMGRDGLAGSRQLVEAGGTVYAQDQASSAVWGMPRAVTEAGLTSRVGTPEQLAQAVMAVGR